MAIRRILTHPDESLRNPAKAVANIDGKTVAWIEDMVQTMYAAPGCGLAAPQIGLSERIVVLDPAEAHLAHTQAIVTSQKLKEAGINVDLQTVDWGTQSARRALKDDPEKNPRGWHIFHTWGGGLAQGSPLTNAAVPSPCDGSNWFGWPCDETLEKIRLEFPMAATADEQKKVIERLQARFYEVVPYIPVGQFYSPVAYRKTLSGVLDTVRLVLWNIEKKG